VNTGSNRGGFWRGGESECVLEQLLGTFGGFARAALVGVSGGAGDIRQEARDVECRCYRNDSPSSGAGESDVGCGGGSTSAQQVEMTAWAADV
jgi:hypothetical protein